MRERNAPLLATILAGRERSREEDGGWNKSPHGRRALARQSSCSYDLQRQRLRGQPIQALFITCVHQNMPGS